MEKDLDLSFFRLQDDQKKYRKAIDTSQKIQHNQTFKEPKRVMSKKEKAVLVTIGVSSCLAIGTMLGLGAVKGISAIEALKYVSDTYGKPTISILDKTDFTLNGYEIDGKFVSREKLVVEKTNEIYASYLERIGITNEKAPDTLDGGVNHLP